MVIMVPLISSIQSGHTAGRHRKLGNYPSHLVRGGFCLVLSDVGHDHCGCDDLMTMVIIIDDYNDVKCDDQDDADDDYDDKSDDWST